MECSNNDSHYKLLSRNCGAASARIELKWLHKIYKKNLLNMTEYGCKCHLVMSTLAQVDLIDKTELGFTRCSMLSYSRM